MEPIYQTNFQITERDVDCHGRLLPSRILSYAQEVAGMHSTELTVGYDVLAQQRMFWAVTRHKVQVTRLPQAGRDHPCGNLAHAAYPGGLPPFHGCL